MMTKIRWWTVFAGTVATLILIGTAHAQTELENKSLIGLNEIYVTLETIGSDAESSAVPVDPLRREVEEMLRQGDVTLISSADLPGAPNASALAITVRSEPLANNRLYSIELRVKQAGTLLRDPQTTLPVTTWFASDLGLTPLSDQKEIRNSILALVADFLTAHHQANPQ